MTKNDRDRQRPPRETSLRITMSHTVSETRLVCRGEIDVTTVQTLAHALETVMTTNPPVLFVDWRSVSFVALAGVDMLSAAARECRAKGIKLHLAPSDPARRVLDIVGWTWIEEAPDEYALPRAVEDALVRALSMN